MDKHFKVLELIAGSFEEIIAFKNAVVGVVANTVIEFPISKNQYRLITVGEAMCFSMTCDGLAKHPITLTENEHESKYVERIVKLIKENE